MTKMIIFVEWVVMTGVNKFSQFYTSCITFITQIYPFHITKIYNFINLLSIRIQLKNIINSSSQR